MSTSTSERTGLGPARRPGPSVRLRLTLSYAGFLVVAGTALSAVMLLVLSYVPDGNLVVAGSGGFVPDRSDLLRVALPFAAGSIAFLAVVGLVGGWFLAGRMLRPLAAVSDAARRAGQGSLTHRIDLPGPDDEFRGLADAFDEMLDRLQRSFEEQRRFTANASHELRTPQAVVKTMLQVARADPAGRDIEVLLERLAQVNDRSILTLESLLHLARAGDGGLRREPVDLAGVVEAAVASVADLAAASGVRLVVSTAPAAVTGDRELLAQLAGNLVRNAVVHGAAGGTASVRVAVDEAGHPVLAVENDGDVLDPDAVSTLVEPFVRAAGRTRSGTGPAGSGLGLAIVASVARAHGADLRLSPRPEGGLAVRVLFTASDPAALSRP